MKYYRDTCNALLAYENPNGTEKFDDWMDNGPYFTFTMARDVTENASYLDAYVTYSADPSGLSLWVLQESTSILALKYNSMGQVIETKMLEHADVAA